MRRNSRARALYAVPVILVLQWAGHGPALQAAVANRILLRVNDRIATLYDYEQRVAQRSLAVKTAPDLAAEDRVKLLEEMPAGVMGNLFEELLILSRSDQLGIVVTDFEIEEAMAEMRERNGLQDDRQFQMALAQAGMTVDDLRSQYRREQARMSVVGREVRPRVELKDEELRRIYRDNEEEYRVSEQIRVREVVVLEGAGDQALAQQIRDQLAGGQSLEQVKESHADELSDILEIGWVAPGDLDAVVEAAVWDLRAGNFSEPVRARGGLHIVEVLERTESHNRPFEEVSDQLYREEFSRRMAEELDDYLEELQKQAYLRCQNPPGVEFCQSKVRDLYGSRPHPLEDNRLGLDEVDRLFTAPPRAGEAAPPQAGTDEEDAEEAEEEIDWGEDDEAADEAEDAEPDSPDSLDNQ